ncbi:glycerophosphodiester phosphodiesterase GDPDL7-like [Impatiens glandulifera]|uniref:glycerophosphodiester phosphodiesterase GDPDL7-like n=1 Tax=Impatiens glandulifera TaxID=253017 RepID=UPI001FB0C4A3|nr:glycerophosphodiester phosphodiesterase GDPDL7-like [Impatiens glandulifera]
MNLFFLSETGEEELEQHYEAPSYLLLLLVHFLIHPFNSITENSSSTSKTHKNMANPYRYLYYIGGEPSVIARGGYSGVFPDSSSNAIQLAQETSLDGLVLLCDLQLTKDSHGICLSSLQLDNTTTISDAFPDGQKSYNLNGRQVTGWFPFDYTKEELLKSVLLTQNVYSRANAFDGLLPITTLEDVTSIKHTRVWLNVQYNSFYVQQKLDPVSFVSKALATMRINVISSPEIGFLKAIKAKLTNGKTKLIFRFQKKDEVEPTTKQTYGSLLNSLEMVKEFASGILVPKDYIWPVGSNLYLLPATTLVNDVHKQGLEIHAYTFANDHPASYNYSYDPTAEYLQFIDNSHFCVDGLVTDFPSTASEAIACLAGNKNAARLPNGALIISHNGASGFYAPCSDLSYHQAIADGADIIDCSVQMSKDGIAFCLDTADLTGDTTALLTFMQRSTTIPEIQKQSGVFSFDFTWSEIQSLKPQLSSPFPETPLTRNPAEQNMGSFVTLPEFLDIAKTKAVTGVLINIKNAAYLASKRNLNIIDAVNTALSNATFDKQVTQKVMIQSDDSQVLAKFKSNSNYETVLSIRETISAVPKASSDEIKKYADSVAIPRNSVIKATESFVASFTNVVDEMHAANISVYVSVFRNEYISMAFDYFADPMVELATFIGGLGVDGVFTEFPRTADALLRSPCANPDNEPYSIFPVQPGSLLQLTQPGVLPPTAAPAPSLTVADVVDPPLPSLLSSSQSPPATTGPSSGCTRKFAKLGLLSSSILSMAFICITWFN